MKKLFASALLLAVAVAMATAQKLNYGKLPNADWYPGYNRNSQNVEQSIVGGASANKAKSRAVRRAAAASSLPDHWNNAEQTYFPPVFSQGGYGACGVTSHVGYMLTSEMNAANQTNGQLEANQLCPMFQYIFTYNGPGKDDMGLYVGYPTADVYGGRYPGSLYGGYEYSSGVAGWMQGYDSWYNAMCHRIGSAENLNDGKGHKYSTNPDTDGFNFIKGYLYNHNGDEAFHGNGGVLCMGVGIASSAQGTVPSTSKNDANSFTGQKYMLHWNFGGGDHAMTIVGYDDRIQFDLDGNGVAGETSNSQGQNENGAWILVNTWGNWANSGFIYAPYAQGGGVSYNKKIPALTDAGGNKLPAGLSATDVTAITDANGNTTGYTYNNTEYTYSTTDSVPFYPQKWYWEPYAYHYRVGYKPQRTMKITMEYVHRSEISVVVGVAQNTSATRPEKTFTFPYINYTGDGTGKDPATPLLGQWADGTMHYEPMEFGIDLTDLSDGFDYSRPLKYFLIINTSADADKQNGSGRIHSASVIDYQFSDKGVETPFQFSEQEGAIGNGGQQTLLSVVVSGESLPAPMNAMISDNTLSWDAPAASINSDNTVLKYYVYKDGLQEAEVGAGTTTYSLSSSDDATDGEWTVKAAYTVNGSEVLSAASNGAKAEATDANKYLTASEIRSNYHNLRIALLGVTTNGDHYINGEASQGSVSSDSTLAGVSDPTASDILRLESAGDNQFYLKRDDSGKYIQATTSTLSLVSSASDATPFYIYGKDDEGFGTIEGFDNLYDDIENTPNEYMIRFVNGSNYLNTQSATNDNTTGKLSNGKGAWSFMYVRNMGDAYDTEALSFSKGGMYVPGVVGAAHSQYTVEFWFRPTNLHDWGDYLFYNTWNTKYMMHTSANGSISAGWANNNNNRINTAVNVLKNNRWTHVALVIDGNTQTIYINGEQAVTGTSTSSSNFPQYWDGRLYFGNGNSLNGKIDELRLWTTARTADQIKANYRTPILNPSQVDGLQAYFKGDTYQETYSDDNGLSQTRLRARDCAQGHDAFFFSAADGSAAGDTVRANATISSTEASSPTVTITGTGTVNVGEVATFGYEGSVGLSGFTWSVTGASTASTTVSNPSFVFSQAGEQTLTLTATDISGQTATATKTITVEDVTPSADFILSSASINSGGTISFISQNKAPACSYQWTWEKNSADTDQETSSTLTNTSTSYNVAGTYTVSLTLTDADNKTYTSSKTFEVVLVAPVEGHQISPITSIKGTEVTLTDKSTNQPTDGFWHFLSASTLLQCNSLNGSITPQNSGVYTLTRNVSNSVGEATTTSGRALIVCNDDSQTGLNFYAANKQTLTFTIPDNKITSAWTIDFWANPQELSDPSLTIKATDAAASADNTLTLTSNAVGKATLTTAAKTSELANVFTQNEWHHYAFSCSEGTITVFRDCQKLGTLASSFTDYSSVFKNITIGGDNSRFSLDELSVWNAALGADELKAHANNPVSQLSDKANLVAYYDFNATDAPTTLADGSGNDITATLTGFDQTQAYISSSLGVFSLDLNEPKNEELDGEQIPRQRFQVVAYSDSDPTEGSPAYTIDGDRSTHWHSRYTSPAVGYPHWIIFRRSGTDEIRSLQFDYNDRDARYRASVVTVEQSDDSTTWTTVDKLHNLFSFPAQNMVLSKPITQKYVRINFVSGHGQFLCIKEINFFGALSTVSSLASATGVYTIRPKDETLGWLYQKPFASNVATAVGGTAVGAFNSSIARDESDPYQQWAIISSGDSYYLYNVGSHRFLNADDATATASMVKGVGAPVSITPSSSNSGYVAITVANNKKISITTYNKYLTASDLRSNYQSLRIALLGVTTTGDHYINGEAGKGSVSTTKTLAGVKDPESTDILLLESAGNNKFYLKREDNGKYFQVTTADNNAISLVSSAEKASAFYICGAGDENYGDIDGNDNLYSDVVFVGSTQNGNSTYYTPNDYMIRFVYADNTSYYLNGQGNNVIGGIRTGKGAWSFQYVRNETGCSMVSSSSDETNGSIFRLVEVPEAVFTDADRAQALRQLEDETAVSDHTVTFNVDIDGQIYYQTSTTMVNRAWIPDNVFRGDIASYKHDYMDISMSRAQVKKDTTVVAGRYTGPVHFSSDYDNAVWYRLSFHNDQSRGIAYNPSHTASFTESKVNRIGYSSVSNAWDRVADNSLWAFVGSPYSLRILNKGVGNGYELQYVDGAGNGIQMVETTETDNALGTWEMHKSGNGFSLNNLGVSSKNLYLNNRGNSLGLWDSNNATTETGSRILPAEHTYATNAFSALPVNGNTRWGQPVAESSGTHSLASLIDAYNADPSVETFKAVLGNIKGYSFGSQVPTEGLAGSNGWVNIHNSNADLTVRGLSFLGSNAAVYLLNLDSIGQLWKATSVSANTVRLLNANTGKYLQVDGSLSVDPVDLSITWSTDSTFTLATPAASSDDASATTASLGITGDKLASGTDNTLWTYADVKSVKAKMNTIGDNTYASSYLPFAVEVSSVRAYTQAVVDQTTDNANTLTLNLTTGTIPALTPMVLVGEKDSAFAVFTIVDQDATATSSDNLSGGLLSGTLTPIAWERNSYLTLGKKNNLAGFYKFKMDKLAANRAYINISSFGSGSNGFTINLSDGQDDDDLTILSDAVAPELLPQNSVIYDLQGRRLLKPQRGINIINGKKVLMK